MTKEMTSSIMNSSNDQEDVRPVQAVVPHERLLAAWSITGIHPSLGSAPVTIPLGKSTMDSTGAIRPQASDQ